MSRIRVSWQAAGRGFREWGMIQDKSEGGLGICLSRPIKEDSVIAMVQGFSTSFGVVKHCTKLKGHFLVGIEFCEVAGAKTEQTDSLSSQEKKTDDNVEAKTGGEGHHAVAVNEKSTGQQPVKTFSEGRATRSWQ